MEEHRRQLRDARQEELNRGEPLESAFALVIRESSKCYGASLITRTRAVTSAKAVYGLEEQPDLFKINIGKKTGYNKIEYPLVKIIRHNNYDESASYADIAVVHVSFR